MDQKQKKKHPVRGKRFGAAGVLLPFFVILLCMAQVLIFSGCGKSAEGPVKAGKTAEQAAGQAESDTVSVDNGSVTVDTPPELPGFVLQEVIRPDYAEGFAICRYEGGYTLLYVPGGESCLVLPEEEFREAGEAGNNGEVSEEPEVPDGITVLRKPLSGVCMAASSVMSLYRALGAVDQVGFSATMADSWYVEEAKEAMLSGDILFAGKYSAPDYEMLLSRGCDLVIESTMIYHHPEVKEKLESLGIPVFVDQSSYEKNPLGRAEWIKVYGVLTGKEAEAEAFFDGQVRMVQEVQSAAVQESPEGSETAETDAASGGEGRNTAFFYINTSGQAVVRTGDDYIAEMIRMAGGEYVLSDLHNPNPDSRSGSVSLTMEEFYAAAKDADYLIYNTNIDSSVGSLSDILAKNSLLGEFRAVKEGRVYLTDRYFYQATDILGEMIVDLHRMYGGEEEMTFLRKLR